MPQFWTLGPEPAHLGCSGLGRFLCRTSPAQTPTTSPAKHPRRRAGRRTAHGPGKAHHPAELSALIIGTNYAGTGMTRRPMPVLSTLRLQNAENDAQKLHDLLIEHYGYKEENVHFLKGAKATKQAIVKELSSGWAR